MELRFDCPGAVANLERVRRVHDLMDASLLHFARAGLLHPVAGNDGARLTG